MKVRVPALLITAVSLTCAITSSTIAAAAPPAAPVHERPPAAIRAATVPAVADPAEDEVYIDEASATVFSGEHDVGGGPRDLGSRSAGGEVGDDPLELPTGVAIVKSHGERRIGITAGPFQNGSMNLLDGRVGSVDLIGPAVEGEYRAAVLAGRDGVGGVFHGEARAYVVGVTGETKTAILGAPNGMTNAVARAEGRALIGASAETVDVAMINRSGVDLRGGGEVIAGAISRAELHAEASVCGISIDSHTEGDANFGVGATAIGHFKVNWSTLTVSAGAKAGLTFGPGVNVGEDVEISLDKLVRDPRAARDCAMNGLRAAGDLAKRTGTSLVNAADRIGEKGIDVLAAGVTDARRAVSASRAGIANAWNWMTGRRPAAVASSAPQGNNVARNAATRPTYASTGSGRSGVAVGSADTRAGWRRK